VRSSERRHQHHSAKSVADRPDELRAAARGLRRDHRRGGLDLAPGVPQQHAAHAALAQVVDHSLPERFLPVFDDLEARIELAHRLVAEVEEVGVEERQMVVRLCPTGHVAPGHAPHRVGVVFVLEAQAAIQDGAVEAGNVARGKDVGMAGTQVLVDHDAVVDGQPGRLRQPDLRNDADAGHHRIGRHLRRAGRHHDARAVPAQAAHRLAGQDRHRPFAEVIVEKSRQAAGINARTDALLGKYHRDALAIHGQRRGDLRADEAPADHCKARPTIGELAQPKVVIERAEVDRAFVGKGQAPGRTAGGQQELLPAMNVSRIVGDRLLRRIERHDPFAEVEFHTGAGDIAREGRHGLLAGPQRLGKRRAIVGGVLLRADDGDAAVRIDLADATDRGRGGHAAADDHVFVWLHRAPLHVVPTARSALRPEPRAQEPL